MITYKLIKKKTVKKKKTGDELIKQDKEYMPVMQKFTVKQENNFQELKTFGYSFQFVFENA